MIGKSPEILRRLAAIEAGLQRVEARLDALAHGDDALRRKQEELDALARQALTVVELLDEARRELRQRGQGPA